jgi:hypothetical protein
MQKPVVPLQSPTHQGSLLRRIKTSYQIILTVSIILNGILAVLTYQDKRTLNKLTEQKTSLELDKTRLENQILQGSTSPSLSYFRLQYDLHTLASQLRKNMLVPLDGIKDSRIVENELFGNLERGLGALSRQPSAKRNVTFLVMHNIGSVTAFASTAKMADGRLIPLGDILPGSALLIPLEYDGPELAGSKKTASAIASLQFQVALGTAQVSRESPVPPPTAQTWTPVFSDLRGIGRAVVTDGRDERTVDLLKKSGRK